MSTMEKLEPEEFELTDDDMYAVEIAKNVARRFLRHPRIEPRQIVGLGNALYALERLPKVTPGACTEFGIVYEVQNKRFSEMRYVEFRISDSEFEISIGGSVYDEAVGGDSFSQPGWRIELGGYREAGCDLYDLEDSIEEYLNLGAQISVDDESEIEFE